MMSPCPSPRHAMGRQAGATSLTIFRAPGASRFESGDDIGQQLILAPADLVAQFQLLLLAPRTRRVVGTRRRGERDACGIVVAMLDAEEFEALGDFFGVHGGT